MPVALPGIWLYLARVQFADEIKIEANHAFGGQPFIQFLILSIMLIHVQLSEGPILDSRAAEHQNKSFDRGILLQAETHFRHSPWFYYKSPSTASKG